MTETTDRELLEAAARAAGYTPDGAFGPGILALDNEGTAHVFCPLTNDGDAFRLAVKLDIDVARLGDAARAVYMRGRHCLTCGEDDRHHPDSYAATRRAIVRAAAAMGEP